MPRINDPNGLSSRPASIVLGELAIAAGIAGRSITLCFEDYPASIVCAICKYLVHGVGGESVSQIRGQGDVNKLEKRGSDVRLVLVQSSRVYTATAWAVQMYVPTEIEVAARPAIICGFAPNDADDDPSPSLALHANADELALITRWISEHDPARCNSIDIRWPSHIQYDPVLDESHWQVSGRANPLPHQLLRRGQVVRSLVTGTCVLRSAQQPNANHASLNVTMDEYEFVRRLLQSRITGSSDLPHDQLAAQMLSRANVYLKIKYGHDYSANNPLRATEYEYDNLERSKSRDRELITRRELADLGNINCATVLKLIEFLKTINDGYDQFGRLGLVRRLPPKSEWRRLPPKSLARLLRPWSMKQIRTHFDVLRRQGLITAERDQASGPWRYELPEELLANGSSFADLPTAQELETQCDPANAS
jgi:hypothetical protein